MKIELTRDDLDRLLGFHERMIYARINASQCQTKYDRQKEHEAGEAFEEDYNRILSNQ